MIDGSGKLSTDAPLAAEARMVVARPAVKGRSLSPSG
jgi:hypothetical protein